MSKKVLVLTVAVKTVRERDKKKRCTDGMRAGA